MCGICGMVSFVESDPVDPEVIERMTGSLAHRGPDDAGYFVNGRVGLGHRRLSIIDLSGGQQPIFNEDRSAAIIFNGEIYNYRELASQLKAAGHTFTTRSDTETILHAYEEYGDDCVNHLRGMFGFAIWDRRKRRLLLARDRLGVKPVYYHQNGRFLAFASEIKALLEIASIPREVDPEAFDMYLALRYVPGPRTMFKDIYRLQPGHIMVADDNGVRIKKYWDLDYKYPEPNQPEAHLLERFRELLEESVRLRLISEVPLGVFLSGGLDSSTILAVMSKLAREHITVVLSGEGADEILAGYGIYGRMLALDRINRGSGALGRLASWIAPSFPGEKLRHYLRMSGQPLQARYQGVSRGFGSEGLLRLIGQDRVTQSELRLRALFGGLFRAVKDAAPMDQMLYVDAKVWLPDDLLIKADKMTMANGLELRVPFLDHKLVEFAATLPGIAKRGGKGGKTLLRKAMRGVLPDAIIDRPKRGFPIPISSWLRTSLRQFTRDLLLARDSACSRFVDHDETLRLVQEHEQGKADRSQEIWTLLVFESWHQHFIASHSRPMPAQTPRPVVEAWRAN